MERLAKGDIFPLPHEATPLLLPLICNHGERYAWERGGAAVYEVFPSSAYRHAQQIYERARAGVPNLINSRVIAAPPQQI